jgi:ketosteroid isomerase-like protein
VDPTHDNVAKPRRAYQLWHDSRGGSARKTGKTAECPKADFFRFRDGFIVEFYELFDSARALTATRED